MITQKKLEIYNSFHGDVDTWCRMTMGTDSSYEMKREDWYLIENLLQELSLMKKGVVSKEYEIKIRKELKDNCDSDETIRQLVKLVN
ncbi:hypothetical protein [uncultured Odoribacter sp.]|uniref:hypothetical protein n=1 Tax=uncultured Odoribacter sp. TaxID=876416 RepID=UPI00260FC568|nr:hypothetical protein [uncultured Odoribacter sp.]